VNELIKSYRIYNEKDFPDGTPGIGIKLVFFPQTGMAPYSEMSCNGNNDCNENNNYCNQLFDERSPNGGPSGNCVSSDDLIWGLGSNNPVAMVPILEYLDFAGQTCGCGDEYLCSFNDYPIGSIYLGLWFTTANGGYYGKDFPNKDMDGFCDYNTGDSAEVDYIRSSCINTRMWKSDTFNNGNPPRWDQYPYVETVQSVADMCNGGSCFSVCKGSNDYCTGGPMTYHEDANNAYIYGGTTIQNEPVACDGNVWPLWTSYIAAGIQPCPASWVGSEPKYPGPKNEKSKKKHKKGKGQK